MTDLDDILYQFGIYPTLRGYHITWVAVDVGREDPEKLQRLTRWLYPAGGRRCGCSSAAVERNLRAAVNRAWETNPKLFSQIARREITFPPTAGDFIWMLCRYLSEVKQEA